MERSTKIVNGKKVQIIFAKGSIIDFLQGLKYTSIATKFDSR